MISKSEIPWIEAGYSLFAVNGPTQLRVEEMARIVGISKSSFYYHFADMEVFCDKLLEWHLQRAQSMAEKAGQCRNIDPDFIHLLIQNREDIFFNRMLRIHRDNLYFQLCYENGHRMVEIQILPMWMEWLDLTRNAGLARDIFTITTDLFYQRLSPENYNHVWVQGIITEVKQLLTQVVLKNALMVT